MRRKGRVLAGAAVLLAIAATGGLVVALSGGRQARAVAQAVPTSTARVQKGKLSAAVSQGGTLTYRARPDGSPYIAFNHARGTYTDLPEAGDKAACGGVLYRVNGEPVLLLCGAVPAYRTLRAGDTGADVRQLNRTLRVRGAGDAFTTRTENALKARQRRAGLRMTGVLALGDAVFLPEAVRIAKVTGQLGGPAQPGSLVLHATSDTLEVQVNLDPSEQGRVKRGNRALITLPGNTTTPGQVVGFGRVAAPPAGHDGGVADATISTLIRLDEPGKARGLDKAPVEVDITTASVDDALSVPVTALVGKAGGGFAVEVVRPGGRRVLVAVTLGLFDTAGGRVQVEGLREGDPVAVPSL